MTLEHDGFTPKEFAALEVGPALPDDHDWYGIVPKSEYTEDTPIAHFGCIPDADAARDPVEFLRRVRSGETGQSGKEVSGLMQECQDIAVKVLAKDARIQELEAENGRCSKVLSETGRMAERLQDECNVRGSRIEALAAQVKRLREALDGIEVLSSMHLKRGLDWKVINARALHALAAQETTNET